nr:hypothetical protein [Tanacetum cinerariifolium]
MHGFMQPCSSFSWFVLHMPFVICRIIYALLATFVGFGGPMCFTYIFLKWMGSNQHRETQRWRRVDDDFHKLRSVETEFSAIVVDDIFTSQTALSYESKTALSYESKVTPPIDNEIDF